LSPSTSQTLLGHYKVQRPLLWPLSQIESCFLLRFSVQLYLPVPPSQVEKGVLVENPCEPARLSKASSTMGCASFMVTSLSLWRSTQNRVDPSFFGTRIAGDAHGLLDGTTSQPLSSSVAPFLPLLFCGWADDMGLGGWGELSLC